MVTREFARQLGLKDKKKTETMQQPTFLEQQRIQKEMRHGEDFFDTQARLERERMAFEPLPTVISDVPEWVTAPSETMIAQEMAESGRNRPAAIAHLQKVLKQDARRLAAMPDATEEVSSALAEVRAAQERADEAIQNHRALIEELMSQILTFARKKFHISQLKTCVLDPDSESVQVGEIVSALVANIESPSPANESRFEALLEDFSRRKLVTPCLKIRLAAMEQSADDFAERLLKDAANNRVNIPELIRRMDAEARGEDKDCSVRWPEFLRYRNVGAFNDLLSKAESQRQPEVSDERSTETTVASMID
jgi:hypothetical protein